MRLFQATNLPFITILLLLSHTSARATELANEEDVAPLPVTVPATAANSQQPSAQSDESAEQTGSEKSGQTKIGAVADATATETAQEPQFRPAPLTILGNSVGMGQFRKLSWSPEQYFSSIETPVPVLVARGKNPGPTVCLTAAIHGDELNGIEMVRRLMYRLEPDKMSGSVIGIPIVNLDGFRRGSRYLSDRRDLNRHFPGNPKGSAADRIAYSLFTEIIAPHCNYLVDLHTGSLKRTNLPQIRADLTDEKVFNFSKHFGGITVLHGQGSRGMLRRAAMDAGIPSVTLEAGGPNALEESAVDGSVKAIETLLQNLEIQPTLRFWGAPQPVFYHSDWVRSDQGGILMSVVSLGDKVKEGEVLGHVTDPITNTGSNIVAPFSGRVIGMAVNQVVQTGFAAYHLGVEKEAEEVKEEALDKDKVSVVVPQNSPANQATDAAPAGSDVRADANDARGDADGADTAQNDNPEAAENADQ